jgi:hypothetical protein
MSNKYAYINDLTLLRKPHKRILPPGPDLANFVTGDANLKKFANFGLEMMKFLPKLEQLIYAGKMLPQGTEAGHLFSCGGNDAKVSQEWWDAFNEFEITDADIDSGESFECFRYKEFRDERGTLTGTRSRLTDLNGDTKITNADTIIWHENNGGVNGWTDWRQDWVAGMHHRTDRFGPFGSEDGSGFAGGGMGAQFKNIDFVAEASEWNHIRQKNGEEDTSGLTDDISYFLSPSEFNDFNLLGAMGKTWDDVKTLLETHPALAGKSYYQIAMDPSIRTGPTALNSEEATLLVAAMYESRERAWACMTEAFGPVNKTRNDADMIDYINKHSLLTEVNAYSNSHALALFPLFLYMQHSFQNQVYMYYNDHADRDAYTYSPLDQKGFLDFTNWAESKMDAYSGRGRDAVQTLKGKWIGAAEVENGRPIWAGYTDKTDGGDWVNVNNFTLPNGLEVDEIWSPNVTDASYGWDRKWGDESIQFKDNHGTETTQEWSGQDANGVRSWIALNNALYGSQSRLNPNWPAGHANYAPAQFYGLNYNSVVMGPAFATNWIVHALGMYLKKGEGLDIVKVMEICSKKREIAVEFKRDLKDYQTRKQEIEDEKAEDERIAMKAILRAQMERKRMEQISSVRRPKPRGKPGPSPAGGEVARTAQEKKDFQKALQKYGQRILKASAKTRAWLNKIKQGNQ